MSRGMRNLTGTIRYVPETTDPAKVLRVTEATQQRPEVEIIGTTGTTVQVKAGFLENGRCTVRFEGRTADATREDNRWVYRIPAEKEDES